MPQQRLTGHQKLGLSVFVVIGIATFVLGFAQLQKAIAQPFVRNTQVSFRTQEQIDDENTQKLKTLDTDHDGLSDYDEQFVFRTSAYLEDSDSDGLSDGAEVAGNTDPNCPKGKECRAAKIDTGSTPSTNVNANAAATTNAAPPQAPPGAYDAIVETFGDPATLTKEQIATKLDTMSSAELRAFLTKMGVPESALQKADDATLKQLLKETLNEISGN